MVPAITTIKEVKQKRRREKNCDINNGKWVFKPELKPSYEASNCPFLEEKMSCRRNGRPDSEFENWIWEPTDCDLIQFNGRYMLERLRGKRMIIVGDSMNRNQWESLACLLYSFVDPSQVEGLKRKSKYQKRFKAKAYDFTLEFDFSPFLVKLDAKHKSGSKVLQLDKISATANNWLNADIMLFNTGHWWVHLGKFKRWDLFEHKGELLEKMKIEVALETGMRTWAKWIDQNVNPNKTMVLFRSISPQHQGDYWCHNVSKPIMDESYVSSFPRSVVDIVKNTISKMRTPVKYLNVTKLSQYRRDAHPGIYRNSRWKVVMERYKQHIPSFVDCSHWCLPGLPDTWNRVLYASMFSDGLLKSWKKPYP